MTDPYDAVLDDLRAKRAQIDAAISALQAIRAGTPSRTPRRPRSNAAPTAGRAGERTSDGRLSGLSIPDAAKEVLRRRGEPASNAELVEEVQRGGLAMSSADNRNTMGALMRRRSEQVGDVVKVAPGIWGLPEWSDAAAPVASAEQDESETNRDDLQTHTQT